MPQYSYLASSLQTQAVLEKHGIVLKHRLGQNFLVNDAVIGRILDFADLNGSDVVLEVGPGIGTLSCALLPQLKQLIAIEADPSLIDVLRDTCAASKDKLQIISGDALKVDLSLLRPAPCKFVSNLPYQVAATLILRVFEELESMSAATVMVQAEVADRISARPGTKAYGAYTVKLACLSRVAGRFEVSASSFMPPPHVQSSVIKLERKEDALSTVQYRQVAEVVNAAFAQRRKTMRNSMSAAGFEKDVLDEAFSALKIDSHLRPEALAPEVFIELAHVLTEAHTC